MAAEVIDWAAAPEARDGNDGVTYVMGCAFTVTESIPCSGVEWEVPDDITPLPGSVDGKFWASLWEGTTRVRNVEIVPTPGIAQRFAFDTPYACAAGPEYTVQVLTRRYTYRTGGGFPYSSPSGIVVASEGRLSTSSDPSTRAAGASAARFYVSGVFGEDDPGVTAELSLTLPALAAQLAVEAPIAATLALTLPALDSALTVHVESEEPAATIGVAAVMSEIASVLRAGAVGFDVVHGRPVSKLGRWPCAVVSWPEEITYQQTYGPGGMERYSRIMVTAVAGLPNTAASTVHQRLTGWISGPDSVRRRLTDHAWTSCDVLHVSQAEIGVITVAGTEYIAAMFFMDAVGTGA